MGSFYSNLAKHLGGKKIFAVKRFAASSFLKRQTVLAP
jgi:hypothetical protein